MHEPIRDGLEDFLRGNGGAEFRAHLETCRKCRGEVDGMRAQAAALRLLRAEEEVTPLPGFYARVAARIEAQRRPSLWTLLLEPAFGRRLMYVSLVLVVLMGTYLVSTEPGAALAVTTPAEQYLAEEHPSVGADPQKDRDVVLVRLATYDE